MTDEDIIEIDAQRRAYAAEYGPELEEERRDEEAALAVALRDCHDLNPDLPFNLLLTAITNVERGGVLTRAGLLAELAVVAEEVQRTALNA